MSFVEFKQSAAQGAQSLAGWLHQHHKRVLAGVGSGLLLTSAAAFALAYEGPQARPPATQADPRPAVETLARRCSILVVPEMNMGQMSREVKRVNNGHARVRTINRVDGQIITPSEILKMLL